jgi:hypothetical protein
MIKDCQGDGMSKRPWIRNRWWLADREVQSPHSTAFFIAKPNASESLVDDYNEVSQKRQQFRQIADHWLSTLKNAQILCSQLNIGMQENHWKQMLSRDISQMRWMKPDI